MLRVDTGFLVALVYTRRSIGSSSYGVDGHRWGWVLQLGGSGLGCGSCKCKRGLKPETPWSLCASFRAVREFLRKLHEV